MSPAPGWPAELRAVLEHERGSAAKNIWNMIPEERHASEASELLCGILCKQRTQMTVKLPEMFCRP